MEFYKEWTLFTGVETPACILSSRWDFCLGDGEGDFTGTPPFGLHPCLYYNVPTGLLFRLPFYAGVTLLWSSIRNNTFYTGTPLRFVPACIITSLRDLRLDYGVLQKKP